MPRPSSTPFVHAEHAFQDLASQPRFLCEGPLAEAFGRTTLTLDQLRCGLLHPATSYEIRDEVLGELLALARADRDWTLVLVGVLLPGLRRRVTPWARAAGRAREDVEAEALSGMLTAIRSIDVRGGRLASRLVWAGARAAHRHLKQQARVQSTQQTVGLAVQNRPTPGHADLVLARAVRAGAVSDSEAQLIGDTRLGQLPLCEAAQRAGVPYKTAAQRRRRAEARLVTWLLAS